MEVVYPVLGDGGEGVVFVFAGQEQGMSAVRSKHCA